jgi:hypothetical protein
MFKQNYGKAMEKSKEFRAEVQKTVIGYITAAFGLIAGLAWNEAIKSLIEYIFPKGGGNTLLAKFIYAITITIVVVVISVYLVKFLSRKKEE